MDNCWTYNLAIWSHWLEPFCRLTVYQNIRQPFWTCNFPCLSLSPKLPLEQLQASCRVPTNDGVQSNPKPSKDNLLSIWLIQKLFEEYFFTCNLGPTNAESRTKWTSAIKSFPARWYYMYGQCDQIGRFFAVWANF